MKIRWYRSATVGVFSDDESTSILCDPWITDGAFLGSWYHWPPLNGKEEFNKLLEQKWSAIYISHLHADHFDRKWISKFSRLHSDTKFLIPAHTHTWLKGALLALGVSRDSVIELNETQHFEVGSINIQVLPADICNPSVCMLSVPCFNGLNWKRSIDSIAIFRGDGQVIVNANDAMATESVPKVMQFINECDLLMASYGGAGPYPQCFPDVLDKKSEAEKLAKKFVEVIAAAAIQINAKAVFPYAGQYLLSGSLSVLNSNRSVLELNVTKEYLSKLGVDNVITLAPFASYDLQTNEISEEYCEPPSNIKMDYLKNISQVKFPYQIQDESWPTFNADVEAAFLKLQGKYQQMILQKQTSKFKQGASFIVKGKKFSIKLNYNHENVGLNEDTTFENLTEVELDDRLLRNLIRRSKAYSGFTPMHWNQAEIGSHLTWRRNGEFFPDLHYLFNFFQS
jgi:UDP-MurNAc hydroxylase